MPKVINQLEAKPKRGGPRPGSGRKKGAATKVLTFRVPAAAAKELKAAIEAQIEAYKTLLIAKSIFKNSKNKQQ